MDKVLQLAPSEGLTRRHLSWLSSKPPACPEERIDRHIDRGIATQNTSDIDQANELLAEFTRSRECTSTDRIGYARQRTAYMETFRALATGSEPEPDQIERRTEYLAGYIGAMRKAQRDHRGALGELLFLAIMPGARPSLWRESHGHAQYNHDANVRIGATKVPIEVKFEVPLSGRYAQDIVQVAVLDGLRKITAGLPGSTQAVLVKLSDDCKGFLIERQRAKPGRPGKTQYDTAALHAVINGIVLSDAHPCETELKDALQLYWRRVVAKFCVNNRLVSDEQHQDLRTFLAQTAVS